MGKQVEFFYDVGSPYSYLASTRIEAIASDCGATLVWRPMLVGGLFKATNNTPPAFLPARARYLGTDLLRWARFYGVPFHIKMPPMDTLLAMRALSGLPDGDVPAGTHALFKAYWVDDQDLTSPATVAAALGEAAVARASEPDVKARLRATTDEAYARGAFGAPTFFVDDAMYFGNDRLPFVEQHLRGHAV